MGRALNGGDGDDTLRGGPDNDTLNGGRDADLLNADDGDDVLSGGVLGAGDDGPDRMLGGLTRGQPPPAPRTCESRSRLDLSDR